MPYHPVEAEEVPFRWVVGAEAQRRSQEKAAEALLDLSVELIHLARRRTVRVEQPRSYPAVQEEVPAVCLVGGSCTLSKWSQTRIVRREGLVAQPDRRGFQYGLSIEFGPHTSKGDLFSFAQSWTKLSAKRWRQIDHAAVLEINAACLAARPEGTDSRRLRDGKKLGRHVSVSRSWRWRDWCWTGFPPRRRVPRRPALH